MSCASEAANWPQWRGPEFNGSTTEASPPRAWSRTNHIAWTAELPGPSAATPIVWDDCVFLSSTDRPNKALLALAFERKSGKLLWSNKVADGYSRDELSNFASPSPLTDGKVVVFFYGNGHLVAFDLQGKELWRRNVCSEFGDFAFQWTFASTPLLFQNRLYLQILQRDVPVNGRGKKDGPIESFLLAMDPSTGQTQWRVVRPCEAVAESHESYATPVPHTFQGRSEILIAGGDCLTGHAADTGAELWRWGTWNPNKIGHWRFVPSPSTTAGIILACAPKGDPIYAIKAGGQGKLTDAAVAWTSERQGPVSSDVPTPLVYQGDFFVLSDVRKALTRLDPTTGKVKWTISTPGQSKYEASPTGAGGLVYTINFRGEVLLVDAAKGDIVGQIPMGDPDEDRIRSTVVAAHDHLFIRTNKRLFCVGN